MSTDTPRPPGLGTRALHAGQAADPATNARAVPIYATTSYVFDDTEHAANLFALKEFGNIYSRLMNPTVDVLEKRLAALDGGAAALAFASGQAAITAAILTICHSGQNFISATSLYGGTWTLFTQTLAKLGIEVRFFDPHHPEQIAELVDANTRCVYLESLGQPEERRARLPAAGRRGARRRPAGDLRQHGHDADAAPPHRARHRHRGVLDHEVHRRARRPHRRRDRRRRDLPVGEGPDPLAGVLRAGSGLPRRRLRGGAAPDRQHRLHHPHPHPLAARHGRLHEPVRRVPVPARSRDAAPAHGAALPERASGRRVPRRAPRRRMGQLPGAARPTPTTPPPPGTCRMARGRSSASASTAGIRRRSSSSNRSSSPATSPTSATPRRWSSIRPRPPTRSSRPRSRRRPA